MMNMTSLTLGDDESIINAEGDMGVYGRVYVTLTRAANFDRKA